jgi:hypothetical protein
MTTSRSALIIISYAVVGLIGVAAVAFVGLQTVSSRNSLDRLSKGVAQAVAEGQARDGKRPVIRGEAVQGKAWTEYSQALSSVQSAGASDVRRWLDGVAGTDRVKAEAALAAHRMTLDFLRAGARKAEGAYPIEWQKGVNAYLPPLLSTRNLTAIAVGQARVLMEAGKSREATDLLLDAAQFSADLGRNTVLIGELSGLTSMGDVFDGLRNLPPDPDLGRALEILEANLPNHGETMRNELAVMGMSFVEMGRGGNGPMDWRFGFSRNSMLLDAWTTLQDMVRRTAATTTKPWGEAGRVSRELEAEAKASGNPIVANAIPGLLRSQRSSREALARLRMLRVLHGGATGLDDPFGGKLLSDGIKVWSVGADGLDGGGVGAWKPADHGDIVLQLPAR